MIFGISEWVFQYRNTWNEVELQPIEMLKTEPIKKTLKYKHGILELWKGHMKKNVHGQDNVLEPNGSVRDWLIIQEN